MAKIKLSNILFVIAIVLLEGCKVPFTESINKQEVFTINCNELKNTIADGESEYKIEVIIPAYFEGDKRKVTVTTTAGAFMGKESKSIEILPNTESKGICYIKSPQKTSKALLTAIIDNHSTTCEIDFKPANPENIYLAFTSKTDSTATVALKSSREKGKVSEDLKVVFEINPANDKVIFDPNSKTDASGGATTNIIFPKTYKGTIKATVGTLTSKEYSIK